MVSFDAFNHCEGIGVRQDNLQLAEETAFKKTNRFIKEGLCFSK